MFYKTYLFYCDHPGCLVGHKSTIGFDSVADAREAGWAISKDRKKCYCPKCAPKHRNVGLTYGGVATWR